MSSTSFFGILIENSKALTLLQKEVFSLKAIHYPDFLAPHPKVQKQLLAIFILVLLIPFFFCVFIMKESAASLEEHYRQQTESENLRVKSVMFDVVTNLYNISDNLANDQDLLNILYTDYSQPQDAHSAMKNYKGISSLYARDTSISFIGIYTFNDSLGEYYFFHPVTKQIKNSSWFRQAADNAAPFWRTTHRTDSLHNTYWELNLYRRIPLPKTGSYAVLNITVSDNYLKSRIDNTNMKTVLSVNQSPVFYSTQKDFLGNGFPVKTDPSRSFYSDSGVMALRGTEVMAAVGTLVPINSDDTIYLLSYNPDALRSVKEVLRNYILFTIAVILLPCILFFFYSRHFSGRVLLLRQAMHQASRGNYDIIDSFAGKDELTDTFTDLKAMIGNIKEKEAQIYQSRIREQEIVNRQQQMEFKMLASQINPHFLYNTLETIRMKAFTAGDREVATAIKLLGKSMRYVLENTGTVSISLEKELNYIHTYISIQKLRFGDRVNFEEDIRLLLPLSEYKILPLMLQPIIENAISHGLEGMEQGGLILLEIREDYGFLLIRISDNGKGMTPEELEALLVRIATRDETRTRSIGLYNIDQRLQLFYGPACKLQVESTAGIKTTFTLRLPLDKIKEDLSHESSYRR